MSRCRYTKGGLDTSLRGSQHSLNQTIVSALLEVQRALEAERLISTWGMRKVVWTVSVFLS